MKVLYRLFAFLLAAGYVISPAALIYTSYTPTAFAQSSEPANILIVTTAKTGAAPFPVTFSGNGGGVVFSGGVQIVYGDGKTAVFCPAGASCGQTSITHLYSVAGTYAAKIVGTKGNSTLTLATAATVTVLAAGSNVPPQCQITATPNVINVGGSVTVRWTSTNATGGAITNIGNVSPSGSINLLPIASAPTTYAGSFTGPGGTANCQTTVTVNTSSSGTGGLNGTPGAGTTGTSGTTDTSGFGNTTGGTVSSLPANPSGTVTSGALPPVNGGLSGSNGGLVPCGTGTFGGANSNHQSSTGCEACDLPILIQNIINFAIGLSIPIAAALFAWAGVLLFTAADNPGRVTQAKQIFKNAFIGFVIAITAWIIINTVLVVIFSSGHSFSSGSWFTIKCSTTVRPVSGDINSVLGILSSSGNINTTGTPVAANTGGLASSGGTVDTGSGGQTCNSGFTYDADSGTCYNPTTDTIQYPTGAAPAGGNAVTQDVANSVTDALQEACDSGDQASCVADLNDIPANGKLTTSQQDTLGDNCDNGDQASCNALDAALNLSSNQTTGNGTVTQSGIAAAAEAYVGQSTLAGPGAGRVSCAWAVNNILQNDGVTPLDGNSVSGMQDVLNNGRGTAISTSDAQPGDIIIWKSATVSHVGICDDVGCTTALSNSSNNAAFVNQSGSTLMGVAGQVYRVKN